MDDERSERDPARPQSAYPDKRQEPEARYHPEGERDSELRATYGAGPEVVTGIQTGSTSRRAT